MQKTGTRLAALCAAATNLEAAIAAQVHIVARQRAAGGPDAAAKEAEANLACEQAMLRYLHAEIRVTVIDRVIAREHGGDA